jgi:hypothetical protein
MAGGAVPLSDLRDKGVRYTGLAGLELQGWLKVAHPGRTQIAVEYRAVTDQNTITQSFCSATVWLEERSIGVQAGQIYAPTHAERTVDLILGSELQPGLYRFKLWTACTPARDLKLDAEVLVKSPADINLRAISSGELLHQAG